MFKFVLNFQSMQDSKLSEDFMAFNTHPISDENREYCIMSEKDIAWRNTFLWIYTIAHVKAVSSYSVLLSTFFKDCQK